MRSLIPCNRVTTLEGRLFSLYTRPNRTLAYIKLTSCKDKEGLTSEASGKAILDISDKDIRNFRYSESLEDFSKGKTFNGVPLHKDTKSREILDTKSNTSLDRGAILKVKGYYNKRGIFVVRCIEDAFYKDSISYKRACIRLYFRKRLSQWGKAGSFMLALILGFRECLDESLLEAFRNKGISHILVLSGMHLNIITLTVSFICKERVGFYKLMSLESITLIFFCFMAGLSPSLFRALVFNLLVVFLKFMGINKPKSLYVLIVTFLLHVALRPEEIYTLSFMLTYGALLGIVLLSSFFYRCLCPFVRGYVATSLSSSVAVLFFSYPIMKSEALTINPLGCLWSILVTPLITLFIYASFIVIILCFAFPFTSDCALFFIHLLYNLIEKSVYILP